MLEHKLIHLYLWVCQMYDKHPALKFQRWSTNGQPPLFTDQELVTIYLWGHLHGDTEQRRLYDYVSDHWRAWFPQLPSYQACNRRLNTFHEVWQVLLAELWPPPANGGAAGDYVLDSVPVMLAISGRAARARVAREHADVGYCATKKMYYHGVKLHLLARRQPRALPVPAEICVTEASRHDLPVLQEKFVVPTPGVLFGDKAYRDQTTAHVLAAQGVTLCTPDKKRPHQECYEVGHSGLSSHFVSALRQPVESFFNWLIEKTGIQVASKVRSADGLQVHCYGKLTVAFFLLRFYP